MNMSAVLGSADIEYINNSAVCSIPVMTSDVANTPPTIYPALHALLPVHSLWLYYYFLHFKQDLQI